MPFGMKNQPPTFQRVVSRAFKNYLDKFIKIFLDDFIVHNDIYIHIAKFKLCFQKCRKFRIKLNPDKCAFTLFSKVITTFVHSS